MLLVSGFVPIQVTGSERVGIVLLVFISVGLVPMFYYCSALCFVLVPCNYSYLVYSPCLTQVKFHATIVFSVCVYSERERTVRNSLVGRYIISYRTRECNCLRKSL